MTPDALRLEVEKFLNEPKLAEFAWYMSVSESRVSRAKEVASQAGWIKGVVEELKEAELLQERGGDLVFQSCNFTVGWKME
jgi:hypothetical protein